MMVAVKSRNRKATKKPSRKPTQKPTPSPSTPVLPWRLETKSPNVHEIIVNGTHRTAWRQHVLLISDAHWDNPHCKREWLKADLDEAVRRNAIVLHFGDFFCAMQGKYDRRSDKSSLRIEHQHGDYLDRLVDTAAEWLAPYKNHIALLGQGNHETAVAEKHETKLIDRLATNLRRAGGITQAGGYCGWVRLKVRAPSGASESGGNIDIYYHHGWGGGGPVTKGAIDFNRLREHVDADVYVMGHIHRLNRFSNMVSALNQNGSEVAKCVDGIRCSTYKDEFFATHGRGWAHEKGHAPRKIGGWWMSLRLDRNRKLKREFQETKDRR